VDLTFDELRARRKPREKTIAIPLDEDLVRQIDELEQQLPLAEHLDKTENRPPKAPRIRKQLDDLKVEARDAAVDFTFRELSRPDYRDVIAAHPDPDGKLRWHEDTFAPALIAACCISHDYTEEQWAQLWDEWPAWMLAPLYLTALEVCEREPQVPFGGRSSGGTDSSPPSSDTAPTEASLIPSS
jgi:hypothetical protein